MITYSTMEKKITGGVQLESLAPVVLIQKYFTLISLSQNVQMNVDLPAIAVDTLRSGTMYSWNITRLLKANMRS